MRAGWTIQPWTSEEDVRLRRLAEEGRTAAVIAERLKRSRAAVYKRAKTIGVALKVVGRGLKAKGNDRHPDNKDW
jgi:hypothetical protein